MELTSHQQARIQGDYHRGLFHSLHDWGASWERLLDVAGGAERARALGIDQIGHFGAPGCDLVVAEIASKARAEAVTIVELGCGFGGALRHVRTGLQKRGTAVAAAVGVDIVRDHVRVFASIGTAGLQPVCGDVRSLPLRTACADVVVCTGSLPHFPQVDRVFAEALRVLRPGGLLVATEEVSLRVPGREVSAAFGALHPPEVFFLTDADARRRQLTAAGFARVRILDLTDWASAVLADRVKVMQLFGGDVAEIFGETEAARLRETLTVAHAEYAAGNLRPALVTAHRPD